MSNYIDVPAKSVPFVKRLFPDYRKRTVCIVAAERCTVMDLNWSGGTRATYTLVRLDDMAVVSLAAWSDAAPWENKNEGSTIDLRPGFAVVKTGYFCGKVAMMYIYVHPSNLAPLLPAGSN